MATNDPTKRKKGRDSSFGLDFSIYGGFWLLLEFDVLFKGDLSKKKILVCIRSQPKAWIWIRIQ
jgi:hypothetical protein